MESITKESLANIPTQLQYIFLCLQGYDYVLHYCLGNEMAILDTISHFKPKPGPAITLDIAIHCVHLSTVQEEALQLVFEMDVEMHALADIYGQPNNI